MSENVNDENTLLFLKEKLDYFLLSEQTPAKCEAFFLYIFKDILGANDSGTSTDSESVFKLLQYLKTTDFFTAPASAKYHGAFSSGLVYHSLTVLKRALTLAPLMLGPKYDLFQLCVACLFHDLAKCSLYKTSTRNVKDAAGKWMEVPYYTYSDEYVGAPHGTESYIRLSYFVKLSKPWTAAVIWHMGAFGLSEGDQKSLSKNIRAYPEVLLLQTADLMAGFLDGI
jgi:hypothetical protein